MTRPRTARPVSAGTAAVILSLLVGCGAAHAPSAPAATTPSPAAAASPAPTTPQARLQALYQVAKKEHGLVFHVGSADWKQYIPLFEQAYPGIAVQTIAKTAPAMATQVIAEGAAHRATVDVVMGPMSNLASVADHGLVAPQHWKSLGVNPANVSSDGDFVWLYDFPFGMAYNTQKLPAADVPTNWNQLLEPRWSGYKIAVHSVEPAVTALFYSRGPAAATAYLQKLRKQKLVFESAGYAIRDLILNGQVLLGDDFIQAVFRELGKQPLQTAPLSPSIVMPYGGYVTKYAPHPAAAELFLAWLATSPQASALSKKLKNMRALPCNVSQLAQYICKKGIKIQYVDTPQKIAQLDSYMKTADRILHPGV